MEAMACGRCVISGDLVTIRELVRHGDTGITVPVGDRNALASALVGLAENRSSIDEFGRRGRQWVEKEFDLTVNARRILRTMVQHGVSGPTHHTS
jgi:glycosyltransferase involved in cell wall biosynthesis